MCIRDSVPTVPPARPYLLRQPYPYLSSIARRSAHHHQSGRNPLLRQRWHAAERGITSTVPLLGKKSASRNCCSRSLCTRSLCSGKGEDTCQVRNVTTRCSPGIAPGDVYIQGKSPARGPTRGSAIEAVTFHLLVQSLTGDTQNGGRTHFVAIGFAQRMLDETDLQCLHLICLLYTSPSPRDRTRSRMPSSA